ncbi:DUF4249 family protein [Fulvivirga lutea]|uniref:DUF4249 family protein n=1 Tax=Fulvivirga lutea TaxID=2810512 RepID=A0A974WIY4_9BACT|nr:DUF4249 family protein [Fulvivirga lutea]QSE98062.1 DUF4249 family protein [Fulvivirga lutea]
MKQLTTILSIFLLIISCEERFEEDVEFAAQDLIVVEGLMTNELKRHRVKLTRPFGSQNEDPRPVSRAFMAIVDSDEEFVVLTEDPVGSGEYYTPPMRAVFGKFYLLVIRHRGKEYRAFDTPPGGQFLGDVALDTALIDGVIHYRLEYQETGTAANYVTHDIDWSATPNCSPQESCEGRVVFYDLKNIDVQEIFATEKDEFYFPQGSTVIRRKHTVSDRYKEFLRSLLSETEWRGGFFDITRDNIPTNVEGDAVGFFATVTVDVDTLIVN